MHNRSFGSTDDRERMLHTSTGDYPLHEYRLRAAGQEWSILHTASVMSSEEEALYLRRQRELVPYGVVLWPAAIALAHEVISRADTFKGARVLELGAGTGLPGIIAASFGAQVVQTDRHELAMSICKRNGERNQSQSIEYRVADWTAWTDTERYDVILGSDILYGEILHPHLRHIFDTNLVPGGRILLSDPFRTVSLVLLEAMEASGWNISLSKWNVGLESTPRAIGLYELAPPTSQAPD